MILDKLNTYETKFREENREAIDKLTSIFNGVIHDFNVITEGTYEYKNDMRKPYEDFVMDLKDDFSPAILKLFMGLEIYELEHLLKNINRRIINASRYVNIYGTPKYGDLARDKDDILNSLQHSLVFGDENEKGFDVDSNIAIFIYDRAFEMYPHEPHQDIYYESEDCIIALDVNAAFVRLLSSKDKFGLEYESLIKDIRMAIMSKIVAYGYSMRSIVHLLHNKFENDKFVFNDINLYRLLELSLARWAYSVVNNLTSNQEYGVNLDTLIDLVKAQTQVDIPEKNIFNVVNLGLAKLRGKEYMMRRSIDKYIEDLKNQYSEDYVIIKQNPYASNLPMRTHRRLQIFKPNHEYDYMQCYPERIISAYESWHYTKDKSASYNFFGMETYLKPTDPKFAEFRRKERQEIMAKLTSNERKRYTDIENDFILLKTEVSNAATEDTQKVLVKRCAMLRDVINLELDRTNNEYLATLLYALDSDVFSLQSDLSDRNIFKERNTRLYGVVKPNGKWDY